MIDSIASSRRFNPLSDARLVNLNAVRTLCVFVIGFGYISTMRSGPDAAEWFAHFGHDPSWFGLQVLFFLSGWLGWRSLQAGRTGLTYLASRARRNWPMLALITIIVAFGLYPALCTPETRHWGQAPGVLLYLFKTLTLIDPGGPMPGALDKAAYACLLQGTVWTLRWGLIAHIGLVLLAAISRQDRRLLLAATIGVTALYAAMFFAASRTDLSSLLPIAPGLRFAYPFLLGASVFAYRDHLKFCSARWTGFAVMAFALAAIQYFALPWTPGIEIAGTLGWCALAMAGLKTRRTVLRDWPPLALPAYLLIWPITQTSLALLPGMSTIGLIGLSLILTGLIAFGLTRIRWTRAHIGVQTA